MDFGDGPEERLEDLREVRVLAEEIEDLEMAERRSGSETNNAKRK